MSEPTPPGVPQDPTASPPPSAPPPAPPAAPPPPAPSAPPSAPPPAGGYFAGPPVSGSVAPAGYANNDEKTWALIAHFGGAGAAFISGGLLGWLAPLVAMLVKGNESPTVRAHAVSALNFQIVWAAGSVISYILFCAIIGFLTLPICILIAVIFGIIGGVKANEGQMYRYPLSISMIK
jgi:uncharacterized protein